MANLTQLCRAPVSQAAQRVAIRNSRADFPGQFRSNEDVGFYLMQVTLPPSMRWGFISVGKNASSSTKRLLFRAEFGSEMTTEVLPLHDINPSAAIHVLTEHRVFTNALQMGLSARQILGTKGPKERICVLRDPMARAVSAYRYLCKSHVEKSRWFSGDRFRMNAVTGFDWNQHTGTLDGFHRFLDYIAWQIDAEGVEQVDGHWRPQVEFIKPAIFQPTIIGRMEDMAPYWRTLSERFGVPLADDSPWENRQPPAPDDMARDTSAVTKVQAIYSADYEAFGY